MKSNSRRDPVAVAATAPAAVKMLTDALDTLTGVEASVLAMRFGLQDGRPRDWREIGQTYGVSDERIVQILHKAMSKLKHPGRSTALADLLADDLPPAVLHRLRERANGSSDSGTTVLRCDRHGWFVLQESLWAWADNDQDEEADFRRCLRPRCRMCPCTTTHRGRSAVYCSDTCRQAGHRFDKRPGRTPALTDAQTSMAAQLIDECKIPHEMVAESLGVAVSTLRRYLQRKSSSATPTGAIHAQVDS